MYIINLKNDMGECVFKKFLYNYKGRNGVRLDSIPSDSHTFFKTSHYKNIRRANNDILLQPDSLLKRIFNRNEKNQIIIFRIGKKIYEWIDCLEMYHLDSDFGNTIDDLIIPYKIKYHISEEKIYYLISLMENKDISFLNNNSLKEHLKSDLESIIKREISFSIQNVEDIYPLIPDMQNNIKKRLNEYNESQNNSVFIDSIEITINDDYIHREEKKRILMNEELKRRI